jgi:hypothetical protein
LAGKQVKRAGMMGAMLTMAGGIYSYSQTAIPAAAPTTTAATSTGPVGFGMNVPGSYGGVPLGGAHFGSGFNYPSANIGGTQIFRI